jgi:hypothetical protein
VSEIEKLLKGEKKCFKSDYKRERGLFSGGGGRVAKGGCTYRLQEE